MTVRDDEFDGRPGLIKKRAHSILLQRLLVALITIAVLGSLTLLVVNAVQGAQTRKVLIDCTNPEGDCAQDGQKRTAKLIKQLIDAGQAGDVATQRVVVLAAACAEEDEIKQEPRQVVRIGLLEDCVNAQLLDDKESGAR